MLLGARRIAGDVMEPLMREGSTSAIADRLTPFEEFNRFVGLEQAVGVEARYESGKEA